MDEGPTLIRELDRYVFPWTKDGLRRRVGGIVSPQEFGAVGDGVTDDTAAIQAAIDKASGTDNTAFIPAGRYLITSTLTVPSNTSLLGVGRGSVLVAGADVEIVLVEGSYSEVGGFELDFSVVHTKSGLVVGDAGNNAARCYVHDLYVDGAGLHGVQVSRGNLCAFRNIVAIQNGSDGIHFDASTIDNNGCVIDGYNDLRGNGRDGLHFEAGASASDPFAPKSNIVSAVISQSNGRYGVYVGTRSNSIVAYTEANTTADIFLDAFAAGNFVMITEGAAVDNGTGNYVSAHNLDAAYNRILQTRLLLSGEIGAGLEIRNDDGVAGILSFFKSAIRNFKFLVSGSSADQTVEFENAVAGFGCHLKTDGDMILNGLFDDGRIRLGAYYLWVDATGDLRIKSGAPASDLDGTVVGTQT